MADEIPQADVWLSEDGTVQAIGHVVAGPIDVTVTAVAGHLQAVVKASVPAGAVHGKARLRLNRETGGVEAAD